MVQQIAPHIPKPRSMLLPVYDEDGASLFRLKVAMDVLYDLLAGVNNTPAANKVLVRSLGTPAKLEKRRFGRRWGLP